MVDPASVGAKVENVVVALFFWRSLDLEGGSGLVAGVVRELEKQGCAVTLLVPDRPEWLSESTRLSTYVRRTPIGTLSAYVRKLRDLSKSADAVLLLENNPLSHLVIGAFLPRAKSTWVHVSSPAVGAEILRQGPRMQYWAHWLAKSKGGAAIIARLTGFRFGHYVVSTKFQKEQLLALGCPAAAAEVVPFGVDPLYFRPSTRRLERGKLVVGYLGHFSPIKGVSDLVAAFDTAARECPGLELRLAWSGKGSEAGRTLKAIEASHARERIEVLGRVDVSDFLSSLDVVALPFRSASIPHFPLVLLEAFAVGIPVISTRVGGLSEALIDGETGFTVPTRGRSELAKVLVRLYEEPTLLEGMRERILADCPARFSTENFCRTFLEHVSLPSRSRLMPELTRVSNR